MTNLYEKIALNAFVLFVLAALLPPCQYLTNANRNYNHPGETHPLTVEAPISDNFNITCYMNPNAFPLKNSSCLHFVNGRTGSVLPRENVVVVNSSTIVYMVRNAKEQQDVYRCKCGSDAIMESKVFVGYKPKPGENFTCRSYDFDYMICNFTKPPNPILTTYNVSFHNGMADYYFNAPCNYDDRILVVCNISLKDRYQEFYYFKIESSNALVKPYEKVIPQYFEINNYEVMIPAKPGVNLRVDAIFVDFIELVWKMPNWELYRAKGLQWEVLVQPENATLLRGEPPVRDHNELRLRVKNLPYPNWHYELKLRVRVRNPKAVWSEQFIYKFRTAAQRPLRPPRMQPGSFYINSMETLITLYWEELAAFEYNGDNFTYAIRSVRVNDSLIDLKPLQMAANLAIFPWQKSSEYEFEICSRNHMGDSIEASRLVVHPFTNLGSANNIIELNPKQYTPKDINNVYHANNRTYTLTWTKPENTGSLSSYTVYWCYPKRALPNECRESMHFQQVSAYQQNFTTEKQSILDEHTLNLAVSANYENFNTGLQWAYCTMDWKSDLVKVDPELVESSSSAIKVNWVVERVCISILDGFNLTYCEVADDATIENATCLDPPTTVTLKKSEKRYNIRNLKPYTMYKISMYMFSHSKKGKPSDPKLRRTQEGAPSPPRQLKVFDVTNTSASIRWMEPSQHNGVIRKYVISLNNDRFEVNDTSNLEYHFENLESFASYKVYVLAQTVENALSKTSNDVQFTTAIGYPSPPAQAPSANLANDNSIIEWFKPTQSRGRIEFYEVVIREMRKDEVVRQRINIIMGANTSCDFKAMNACKGPDYGTTVEVRAVNAALLTHETNDNLIYYNDNYNNNDDDGANDDDLICDGGGQTQLHLNEIQRYFDTAKYHLYRSQWQTLRRVTCAPAGMNEAAIIACIVVAMFVGVSASYMARKKYNKMANIKCTLPAGLDTYFTKDNNTGYPGDFGDAIQAKTFASATREAEDQWLNAARMHEFNFRNEHHHLLSSLGNDSGYLGGGGSDVNNGRALSSSIETNNETDDCSANGNEAAAADEYENQSLKASNVSSSADSLVDSTDDSTSMHDVDNEQDRLALYPKDDSGYIKQSMLQPWMDYRTQQPGNVNNGYISVQSLDLAAAKDHSNPSIAVPQSSGYVLQQDLQNFFKNALAQQPAISTTTTESTESKPQYNDGYTTFDDLAKLNQACAMPSMQEPQTDNNHVQEVTNQPPPSPPIPPNDVSINKNATAAISGYVTQLDLNIFAQHQQQH